MNKAGKKIVGFDMANFAVLQVNLEHFDFTVCSSCLQTGGMRLTSSTTAGPASLANQHRHLSLHNVVRRRQGNQRMWLCNNVAQARGRFSSDHGHTFASSPSGDCDSWPMGRAVTRWRWCIRYRTGVLVANAPGGLATDENRHARSPQQWRTVHRRIA